MLLRIRLLALGLVCALGLLAARADTLPLEPESAGAAQIQLGIERVATFGTALYIGAHPDDENTAALAALSLGRGVRTVYLSLTRGEGGQNLIGPQQGEALGVIRTQELLAARSVDHAEQRFTRAIDFGYCKTPEEALRLWGHDAVLADVVWTIRELKPDVIITRFTSAGGGHGHHTASAMIAEEAFVAAADPKRFPDQLQWVSPWQAHRLVWNRYQWGRPPATKPEKPDDAWLDVGAYRPLLGRSFVELAAMSRSMHKSQAMGTSATRGQRFEWFEHVAGQPVTNGDLFDGIHLSWGRLSGGADAARVLERVDAQFDPLHPEQSVVDLAAAWHLLGKLDSGDSRVAAARSSILDLIRDCAGLWIEVIADRPTCAPGETLHIATQVVKRADTPLKLVSIATIEPPVERTMAIALGTNEPVSGQFDVTIPADAAPSQPYWLQSPAEGFLHALSPPALRDRAEAPAPLRARVTVEASDGTLLPFEIPILDRSVDPVEGERYREVTIVPPVSVRLAEPVVVVRAQAARAIEVTVTAHTSNAQGTLSLALPEGWSAEPSRQTFNLASPGDAVTLGFSIHVGSGVEAGLIEAVAQVGDRAVRGQVTVLDFPHFPPQTLLEPARAHVVRLEGNPLDLRVGYVMGSGDTVPQALSQLGCSVELLADADLLTTDLARFDAIVTGARAFNTRQVLAQAHERLMSYVEQGGRLVVQYNTTRGLVTSELGPYPFSLSRDRVSVETVPVTLTMPSQQLLSQPYRITSDDFEGWVQERGLYFPGQWDERYEAPLECADPGEPPRRGGLLVTHYGKGLYIYTSYSLFRQLPAGVPGAFRLLTNLVAGGDTPRSASR